MIEHSHGRKARVVKWSAVGSVGLALAGMVAMVMRPEVQGSVASVVLAAIAAIGGTSALAIRAHGQTDLAAIQNGLGDVSAEPGAPEGQT